VHYQFAGERIGPTIPCKHISLRNRGRKTVTLAAARAHHAMAAARVIDAQPAANRQCAARGGAL